MAWENIQEKYIPRNNDFYRSHYHQVIIGLIILVFISLIAVAVVFYQVMHRPQPVFDAVQADGQMMQLKPYDEPNLLADTILRWASKAAILSYSFNYVNYRQQLDRARPFYTEDGWNDYLRSVDSLLNRVVANQLFVNSVVYGTPVISNEGPIPGHDYVWRVQIPFLVTYQSGSGQIQEKYYVVLTIVRVPTSTNPQGIGIDQFVMV